jgi:hypothetical protein
MTGIEGSGCLLELEGKHMLPDLGDRVSTNRAIMCGTGDTNDMQFVFSLIAKSRGLVLVCTTSEILASGCSSILLVESDLP